ncbi:unnamed protein product [Blepharisma stoltei]|uniref:EF-hand domain-containing protein n=1 Tax=Blepharisma stoltei TaxID=1481888 RepID=A0AAU9IQM1_9CILI|nr:unnamed protein product [Blepharisma stoltei]
MGCCVAKNNNDLLPPAAKGVAVPKEEDLTLEDKIILEQEKKLHFSRLLSKEIVKSIKAESLQNSLSLPQLKRVFHDLQIPESELTSPDTPTYHLLSKVKNENKLYDTKKLSLIGIVIGIGTAEEKADWLFRQFDVDATGMLDPSEIEEMLGAMVDVCANILPVLAKGEGIGFMNKEDIDAYKDKLISGKDEFIREITKQLLVEKEISQHELTMKLGDINNSLSKLLYSYGVRSLLRKYVMS